MERCVGCRDLVPRRDKGAPWCEACLALPAVAEERRARVVDVLRRSGVEDAERLAADVERFFRVAERLVPKTRSVNGKRVDALSQSRRVAGRDQEVADADA